MKKILIFISLLSLRCVGMNTITFPNTEWVLDLSDEDPISMEPFTEIIDAEGNVDIVAIPTGVTSPPHYFAARGLKNFVRDNLYQNPINRQIFRRNDIKVLNVKNISPPNQNPHYVTLEKNSFDIFPQGFVQQKAQEFLDEGRTNSSYDPLEAKVYFEKVAEQEDNLDAKVQAEFELGFMYSTEQLEDDADYQLTLHYYKKAAEQNNNMDLKALAEFSLGTMHLNGKFGTPNLPQAQHYYKRAAEQNDNLDLKAQAEFSLGSMYLNGQIDGTPNLPQAKHYLEKAAEQNNNLYIKAKAEFGLGLLYSDRQLEDTPNFTHTQRYLERAAEQNVNLDIKAQAELELGLIYFNGLIDDTSSFPQAKHYLERAASQDVNLDTKAKAELELGLIYFHGLIDGTPNFPQAKRYLERAAAQDVNPEAKTEATSILEQIRPIKKRKRETES